MQESLTHADLMFCNWLGTLAEKQDLEVSIQDNVIHVTCKSIRASECVWHSRHHLPLARFALLIHVKGCNTKLAKKLN